MIPAEIFVGLLETYLFIGAVFAVLFVPAGIKSIDPAAEGSTLGFRIIIVPGVILLWPLLFKRWMVEKDARMIQPLRRAHRAIWIVLPVILGVLFFAALLRRGPTMPINPNVHWEIYK
jgi:hypothetical protein